MKISLPLLVCLAVSFAVSSARAQAPKTQRERVGYSLGAEIASTLKQQGIDFDLAAFNAGVRDALSGNRMQMTASQRQDTLSALKGSVASGPSARPAEVDPGATDKNKRLGSAFLAANGAKPGVQTTASGLQYKVVKDGAGSPPKTGETVTVKYRGALIDGTEFDNSEKHDDGTLTVPLSGVIPGWTEALKMMRPGAKWQLFIPASLAYGDQAVGPLIGPGSTLVFDVELLAVKK